MKIREIKITIKGTQHDILEETTENTYTGQYTYLSDTHIIKYNEYLEEENTVPAVNKNLVKINDTSIHITKKGAVNTQMHFEQGKKHYDVYQTPFGDFNMMIDTEQVTVQKNKDILDVTIVYSLSLNHCPVSKCTIQMQISGI